jgi:hypothetical protein
MNGTRGDIIGQQIYCHLQYRRILALVWVQAMLSNNISGSHQKFGYLISKKASGPLRTGTFLGLGTAGVVPGDAYMKRWQR